MKHQDGIMFVRILVFPFKSQAAPLEGICLSRTLTLLSRSAKSRQAQSSLMQAASCASQPTCTRATIGNSVGLDVVLAFAA